MSEDLQSLPLGAKSDPALEKYDTPFEAVAALFQGEPTSTEEVPLERVRIIG